MIIKVPVRTAEELLAQKAASVRTERNAVLSDTDYMGLADYPNKVGELEYRQALRNVPQQSGFPNEINWPTLEVSP